MRRWMIAGAVIAVVVVGALFALVLAGGSGDEAAGEDGDPMAAFRECMADEGVEIPETPEAPGTDGPVAPGGGAPMPGEPPAGGGMIIRPGGEAGADREAMEACQDLLPAPSEGAEPGFRVAPQD